MALQVGELFASLRLDADEFNSGMQQASNSLNDLGGKVSATGGTVTALSAPFIATTAVGLKMATDISNGQNMIQASLGVTGAEAERLSEISKSVWRDGFGPDLETVNSTLIGVQQQIKGVNDADLQSITQGALTLEQVFGADVNDSIKSTDALMTHFGVSGTNALDLITYGFQNGGNYSGELLDTLNEYAPQFSAMGLSAEQMMGILIAGAEAGAFNMDKVGDSVKEFNIRMKDGSDTTSEALTALNLDANAMSQAMAQGGEAGQQAFMAILASLSTVEDPLERNRIGVALFGTQWEDLESTVVTAMAGGMAGVQGFEGATAQAGETMQSGLGAQLTQLGRQLSEVLAVGVQPLIDIFMTTFLPMLQKLVEWFTNLSPSIQTAVVVFGALFAALGPVLVIGGQIITAVGSIIGVLGKLGPVFTALTGPIGIAVAAIAGAIAIGIALWKNWDEVSAFLSKCWEGIKAVAEVVWNGIKALFETVWNGIKSFLETVWNGIKLVAEIVWNGIKAYFETVLNIYKTVFEAIWNGIKSFLEGLWNGIKKIAETIWNGIKAYFETVLNIYKTIFETIWNAIKSILEKTWDTIKSVAETVFNAIKSYFENVLNAYKTLFEKIWDGIKSFLETTFNAIKSTIETIWNAIKSFLETTFNAIKSFLETIWNGIKSFFETTFNAIKTLFETIFNAIKSFLETTFNGIKSTAETIWNGIKTFLDTTLKAIQTVFNTVWNAIKTVTTTVWNSIKDLVNTIWNGLKSTATTAFTAIQTAITNVWNNVKSTTSSIWSGITSSLSSAWNTLKNTVSTVFNGIKSTISSIWNSIVSTIRSAVNSVVSLVNGVIGRLNSISVKIPNWVPGYGGQSFGINIPKVPQFANGTSYFGGGPAIVGEEGPELVNLPRGSSVTPNEKTEKMLGGTEGMFAGANFYVADENSAKVLARELGKQITKKSRGRGLVGV